MYLAVNTLAPFTSPCTTVSLKQLCSSCVVMSTAVLLQVTVEDFEVVCKGLYRALCIREKYMQKSLQRFPRTPSQYLRAIEGEVWRASDAGPGMFRHLQSFAP